MLYWSAVFFIVSLVSAVFGFGGAAVAAAEAAKVLFVVFLVLSVLSFLFGRLSRFPKFPEVTISEWQRWEAIANRDGVSLEEWCRIAMRRYALEEDRRQRIEEMLGAEALGMKNE